MKELHRARVVAIGSEEDMAAVCRTLLANCDWLEIPDDRPPYSLEELRQQVKQHAEELGGEESGFYYGMVARYTYGTRITAPAALTLRASPADCGRRASIMMAKRPSRARIGCTCMNTPGACRCWRFMPARILRRIRG